MMPHAATEAAAYGGWYEIFPAAPVFYNAPVQPGDAMSAAVTAGAVTASRGRLLGHLEQQRPGRDERGRRFRRWH